MADSVPLPEGFEPVRERGGLAAVRVDVKAALVDAGVTDAARLRELRSAGAPAGRGRGQVVSFPLGPAPGERVALRHCHRGGVLGRLLGDRYASPGRFFEELRVCEAARRAGVPAPECLAVIAIRRGAFWRGDLLFRELPDATSLESWLRQGPSPEALRGVSSRLAEAFGRLVAAGIYHPDLHAANVLVQERGGGPHVCLIDFDRAHIADPLPPKLRDRMLFRFNRALVKRRLAPQPVTLALRFRFCRELGDTGSPDDRRGFVRRCAAHLRRHAWHY